MTNDFRFFLRGEPVVALKSSSLRGNVLLSTALFVSGEVLIGARAKRALLMRPSLVKNSISTVCKVHCKLKRSVSTPKCQFSPAGQSLNQPFLEPFDHNLGQKSSIKWLFQPTVGPISALGQNQP